MTSEKDYYLMDEGFHMFIDIETGTILMCNMSGVKKNECFSYRICRFFR